MAGEKCNKLELDRKLIELVKSYPLLYAHNVRSMPYKKWRNSDLWKSIGTSLGMDGNSCIARWRVLRNKFTSELKNCKDISKSSPQSYSSDWLLFNQMLFLHKHEKKLGRTHLQSSSPSKVTTLKSSTYTDEDLLPEAMDEQNIIVKADKQNEVVTSCNAGDVEPNSTAMKQIECLLDGFGTAHRHKAEKQILAYLCKCQLKILNNEDIDDVHV